MSEDSASAGGQGDSTPGADLEDSDTDSAEDSDPEYLASDQETDPSAPGAPPTIKLPQHFVSAIFRMGFSEFSSRGDLFLHVLSSAAI